MYRVEGSLNVTLPTALWYDINSKHSKNAFSYRQVVNSMLLRQMNCLLVSLESILDQMKYLLKSLEKSKL